MSDVKRSVRVSVRLREELAWVVSRDLRDPRTQGVSVTRVEMPDDLKSARVYVRLLEGGDDEARRALALTGLSKAAPLLRKEVTKRVGLRYAPELRFYYDEGQERSQRIEELLREVSEEKASRPKE